MARHFFKKLQDVDPPNKQHISLQNAVTKIHVGSEGWRSAWKHVLPNNDLD